jgi:acetylglutamate kinase
MQLNDFKPEEIFQDKATNKVLETLEYVKRFCGQKILIKIGGAPLQNPELVKKLCSDLSLMRASGISLVLVHGGGAAINQALEQKGIKWSFHDGQRVTTKEMVETVEEVLCGQVNKKLVRTLNAAGVKAVGLSGTDGQLLQCSHLDPALGEVGQIDKVNTEVIEGFIEGQLKSNQGYIPVVSSFGMTTEGEPLNINADWVCVALARALDIPKIVYLTDEDGILNGEGALISDIDMNGLQQLIETGAVKGGMLTKVKTILDALEAGVQQVHIINGSRPHSLIEEVFTNKGVGTVCQSRWEKGKV